MMIKIALFFRMKSNANALVLVQHDVSGLATDSIVVFPNRKLSYLLFIINLTNKTPQLVSQL